MKTMGWPSCYSLYRLVVVAPDGRAQWLGDAEANAYRNAHNQHNDHNLGDDPVLLVQPG